MLRNSESSGGSTHSLDRLGRTFWESDDDPYTSTIPHEGFARMIMGWVRILRCLSYDITFFSIPTPGENISTGVEIFQLGRNISTGLKYFHRGTNIAPGYKYFNRGIHISTRV